MKQSVRITSARTEDGFTVLAFDLLGEAISAEDRACFRVSSMRSDLSANVEATTGCPVLDVSATGFAVAMTTAYEIGDVVSVVFDFAGEQLSGTARVQSISPLKHDQIRYGLNCNPDGAGDNLKGSLVRICMAIQREKLKRLAGLG